ncbi:FAD binding domain-containing protein [Aspergillus sp. HF37]|nr:FAD binding domain-containing protein [Aspergillus sp. HF37]
MAPPKILSCGGGCAGPPLAFPQRASGAQIDLHAQGIEVAKRMGLLDVIRNNLIDKSGVSLVGAQGHSKATIMTNKSGKGAHAVFSIRDNVEYIFGKIVETLCRMMNTRWLTSPTARPTHLISWSARTTRDRAFGNPFYQRLGIHMAYWFVPRTETDINIRETYHIPAGRWIMRRSYNPTETQVYFVLRENSEELRDTSRAPVEQQRELWAQRFRNAGWQVDRFLEGLNNTENFYCQEVVQVYTDSWHSGRVVLLGDVAHCPSPFSGMETTSSFVGAYVLDGEISRNPGNLPQALADYDITLRPFVNKIQPVSPFLLHLCIPETQWRIVILHFTLDCSASFAFRN